MTWNFASELLSITIEKGKIYLWPLRIFTENSSLQKLVPYHGDMVQVSLKHLILEVFGWFFRNSQSTSHRKFSFLMHWPKWENCIRNKKRNGSDSNPLGTGVKASKEKLILGPRSQLDFINVLNFNSVKTELSIIKERTSSQGSWN